MNTDNLRAQIGSAYSRLEELDREKEAVIVRIHTLSQRVVEIEYPEVRSSMKTKKMIEAIIDESPVEDELSQKAAEFIASLIPKWSISDKDLERLTRFIAVRYTRYKYEYKDKKAIFVANEVAVGKTYEKIATELRVSYGTIRDAVSKSNGYADACLEYERIRNNSFGKGYKTDKEVLKETTRSKYV